MPGSAPPPQILVIDDDPGLARLIVKTLRREGLESSAAHTAKEALAAVQKSKPNLLLLDLQLPDMRGPEVIQSFASQGISVPFVVITGQGDERVAVEMMKRGALDYLIKDADFLETMAARVQRVLDELQTKERLARTEEALNREFAFSSAVLETLGALVVVLDFEGRIRRWNRACEETTGYSREEVLGKPIAQFIPPDETSGVRKILVELQQGRDFNEFENHLHTRNGERKLISWSNTSLRNSAGAIEHIIATGIDITERKELERELLEISNREKLRIGQDLHDGICQELTAIELMSEVLEQRLVKKAPAEAAQAGKIAANVRQTIVNTKNVARGLTPVFIEAQGLASALEELCAIFEKVYHVNCSFKSKEPLTVQNHAAATHLYRIAQEAATNAIKHGGATKIVMQVTPGDNNENLNLEISDNGKGFPEKLDNSKGMGLRIMKHRAGMIGGSIEFNPATPRGARVICTFSRKL
jgi:PAS domain S-box-containing protein